MQSRKHAFRNSSSSVKFTSLDECTKPIENENGIANQHRLGILYIFTCDLHLLLRAPGPCSSVHVHHTYVYTVIHTLYKITAPTTEVHTEGFSTGDI